MGKEARLTTKDQTEDEERICLVTAYEEKKFEREGDSSEEVINASEWTSGEAEKGTGGEERSCWKRIGEREVEA